jgi:signal transduction histidine kinase
MRRLESRLRDMQSLADLGEMSAGIAHEFRNSLSTIVGYLRLARRGAISSETEERLQRADEEVQQLAAAVESLLVFARPMQMQRQRVDLGELARATVERFAPLAGGIAFELSGGEAWIEADGVLLGRAIENLVRNAIDAIDEKQAGGGRIRLETAAAPHPMLVIRDDGVGLDPADVNRLFLPFQSTKPQGFGVGLALARKIVVLHGGTIALTGNRGKGATATIVFTGDGADLPPRQQS